VPTRKLVSANESVNQLSAINQSSFINPPNPTDQLINQISDSDKQHFSTLLATALAVNECEPKTFKQATSCAYSYANRAQIDEGTKCLDCCYTL